MTTGLGHDLRIKYGLSDDPHDHDISEWAARTTAFIAQGVPHEQAGRRAAAWIFGQIDQILYFSEADTIEALIARAIGLWDEQSLVGESSMSDIGPALRIKYKLREVPTDDQAANWADLVDLYVAEGRDPEDAGRLAADQLFQVEPDLLLKAEADTIESLLEKAKRK